MISLRKVLGVVTAATMLAGFPLPAGAAEPQKIYSINVSALGVAPVAVTIKNETPNGNSTINSFIIYPPAGISGVSINGYVAQVGTASVTQPVANGPIFVRSFTGLQAGNKTPKSLTILLNVTYPAGAVCPSYTWTAEAFAGNSWGQEQFGRVTGNPPTNPTQATTCNLTISTPSNVVAGVAIGPAVVSVLNSSGSPVTSFTGAVSVYNGTSCTGTPLQTVNAVAGVATFPSLVLSALGSTQITACTTVGATTFSATSGAFTVFASGPLACEPGFPFTFNANAPGVTSINQAGFLEGQRGAFNKNAPCIGPVAYTIVNDILGSNSATVSLDPSEPGVALMYTITWKPEYVNSASGMPSRVTKLRWGSMPPGSEVPGRACIATNVNGNPAPYLPAPYGTLAADITSDVQTVITVTLASGVVPPAPPFAITIGLERLTVTDTSGNWTVVRGVGGTTAAPSVPAGAYVMSNPLPLDGSSPTPLQMQMCIAEEGFSIVPAGNPDCPVAPDPGAPAAPTSCVIFTTTVYDIADGYVSRGGN